jgi:hypothetical protein
MIRTLICSCCHIFLKQKEEVKVNAIKFRRQLLMPFVPEINTTRTVAYLYIQEHNSRQSVISFISHFHQA